MHAIASTLVPPKKRHKLVPVALTKHLFQLKVDERVRHILGMLRCLRRHVNGIWL